MTTRPTTRHALAALATLCAALSLAACSASPPSSELPSAGDPTSGSDTTPPATLDPEDALLAYARCLREHGIDAPDPVDGRLSMDGNGLTPEQIEAAQVDCEDWQRLAEPADDGEPLAEEEKQKFLDRAQCMRDKGWNVPDPEFSGGRVTQKFERVPGGTPAPGDPNPEDPQFRADEEECTDEVGLEPPSSGGVDQHSEDS